jgi:hypothetical protein
MSKKKKRKFYNSSGFQPANSGGAANGANSANDAVASMSAPGRISGGTPANAVMADVHAEEYQVIRHDLLKVVILNAVFLAGVLTLYYTNLHSHYLERWFGSILHF